MTDIVDDVDDYSLFYCRAAVMPHALLPRLRFGSNATGFGYLRGCAAWIRFAVLQLDTHIPAFMDCCHHGLPAFLPCAHADILHALPFCPRSFRARFTPHSVTFRGHARSYAVPVLDMLYQFWIFTPPSRRAIQRRFATLPFSTPYFRLLLPTHILRVSGSCRFAARLHLPAAGCYTHATRLRCLCSSYGNWYTCCATPIRAQRMRITLRCHSSMDCQDCVDTRYITLPLGSAAVICWLLRTPHAYTHARLPHHLPFLDIALDCH